MHEARLYEKTENNAVKCSLCNHRCAIHEDGHGICGVRLNEHGTLFAATYGRISSEAVDPVEKKPLFHYLPGTLSYSLGSIGCNFHCQHCQNWHISRAALEGARLQNLSPEEGVERAITRKCASISWNGYITEEGLRELAPMLSAYRVDIKAFTDDFYKKVCGARLQPVLDSAALARELGMHVETVTLVIPGLNDSREEMEKLILWVIEHIGPSTPMHFSAFHPDYKMTDRGATPLATLEKIYTMAKELGLRFPYLGNVYNHPYENTYCPVCGVMLIGRQGFSSTVLELDGQQCRNCGEKIEIVRYVS
jgi:pyruvate formate lyase activating enzyme